MIVVTHFRQYVVCLREIVLLWLPVSGGVQCTYMKVCGFYYLCQAVCDVPT